jgi:hypothetical protein
MLCCPAAATLVLDFGRLALLPLLGPAPAPAAVLALRLMPAALPAALPPACLALPAALRPACLALPSKKRLPASSARTWACAAGGACCATVQLTGASAAVGVLPDGCWLSPDLLAAAGAVACDVAVAAGAAMCPAVSAASCCQAPAAMPSAPSSSSSSASAALSMRVCGLLLPVLLANKSAGAGAGATGESVKTG